MRILISRIGQHVKNSFQVGNNRTKPIFWSFERHLNQNHQNSKSGNKPESKPEPGLKVSKIGPEVISVDNVKKAVEILKGIKIPGRIKRDVSLTTKYAVLIPFVIDEDGDPALILTLRSSNLASHKSQISFPGGKIDAEDENDAIKAAIRETNEEIGLNKDLISIIGVLNPLPTKDYTGLIFPVISIISSFDPSRLKLSRDEVEKVLIVKLSNLCNQSNWRYTRWKSSQLALPVYRDGVFNDVQVPRIFGITALMIHMVLSSLVPEHHLFTFNFLE